MHARTLFVVLLLMASGVRAEGGYERADVGLSGGAVASGSEAALARPNVGHSPDRGWFFYKGQWPHDEDKKKKEQEKKKQAEAKAEPEPPKAALLPRMDEKVNNPQARLKALQQQLEYYKALAVLQPTPQNVIQYARMEKEIKDRESILADVATEVGWQRPDLNFATVRPANPAGLRAWAGSYNDAKSEAFERLATDYALLFFFRSDCPHCHRFAPFVKRFATRYGFHVRGISIDGGGLPDFPKPDYRPNVARRLRVTQVPALFLADMRRRRAIPVTFGTISLSELARRIYKLTQMKPGDVVYSAR